MSGPQFRRAKAHGALGRRQPTPPSPTQAARIRWVNRWSKSRDLCGSAQPAGPICEISHHNLIQPIFFGQVGLGSYDKRDNKHGIAFLEQQHM